MFKSQIEAIQALLEGKKLIKQGWFPGNYICIKEGSIMTEEERPFLGNLDDYWDWSIVPKTKAKKILYIGVTKKSDEDYFVSHGFTSLDELVCFYRNDRWEQIVPVIIEEEE